jgi:signal transduction histidine kinase
MGWVAAQSRHFKPIAHSTASSLYARRNSTHHETPMVPLEHSKLFGGLTPDELKRLREVAVERRYDAGTQIFQEGDPGDGLYVVKEGLVAISSRLANGESCVLGRIGPGDIFGEMAVLDSDPRSASVVADVETTAYFIRREDLLYLLEHTPKLSASLVRETSRRLRDFNRQYLTEVLQAERLALVGRFARSIVHDLKNPLNIIGIAAELTAMSSATAETRVAARNRIQKQVERISIMINELLEFTRGSQTEFVLGETNYAEFVCRLIEEVKPEIAMKSVEIQLENPPPAIELALNPARITRVFHNLMHNATDAMPEGGAIKLRFSSSEKEIITEIEDTGEGFPAELAGKIFQPFATFGKAHGTGLGLSICKKIVEDHHGRIYLRSEPNRGAIFVFHLPRRAKPASPAG